MKIKAKIIDGIIDREGGYVDDPSDSGGETNFGITKHTAIKNGYFGGMNKMPRSTAFEIYSGIYWDGLMLNDIAKINTVIAEELADTAVNMGVYRAGEFFQRSLNVLNNREQVYSDLKVDGQIGTNTIRAFKAYIQARKGQGIDVLFKMLNSLQGAFYVELAERRQKDEKFIFGWFSNRVF